MDELLKVLRTNAQESPATLAKMLNTTEKKITTRIKALEKKGVIIGYQAIVNDDHLEHEGGRAVIEVKVKPEREGGFNRVANRIAQFPQVETLFLMSGTYDLLVFVRGKNLRDVATFVSERLAMIEGVEGTATHFMLKTYKDKGVLVERKTDERLKISP